MKKMIESDADAFFWGGNDKDHKYTVAVTDFVLYVCMVEGIDTTKGQEISYNCSSLDCHIKQASQNYYGSYSVKPSTYKFGFSTQSSETAGTATSQQLPPTVFRTTKWMKCYIMENYTAITQLNP